MAAFIQNAKIGLKLPVVIGGLVALTILVMATANAFLTSQIIMQNAGEKLQSVAQMNTKRMQFLLENIERDLRLQAAAPATATALIALADGYNTLENAEAVLRRVYIDENEFPVGEKDNLVKADTGSSYGFIHAIYHPVFKSLQEQMTYYDVFLFDAEGNLVYSVFKESDFATNMLTGPWAKSGLADAYRRASAAEAGNQTVFVDFASYGPSGDAPAAFMARPVFDAQGKRLGVLAYQMPVTQLNTTVSDLEGLGATADGFLVGSDRLMRTDSKMTEQNDVLLSFLDTAAVKDALAGKEQIFEGKGHHGQDVIGYATKISMLGVEWVNIVQQDRAELFGGLTRALIMIAIISALILACALTFAVFFSRSISRPLQKLSAAVRRVTEGELETEIPCLDRGDEIGILANQTEVFRNNAMQMEKMAEKQEAVAKEMTSLNQEREASALREAELSREKELADEQAKRERDEMMAQLGTSFGRVVTAARNGDFSNRIDNTFDDAVLAELATGMNALMQDVDDGLTKTGAVLARVAAGDLTQTLDGTFKGAFKELQMSVNGMLGSLTTLISEIAENSDILNGSSSELRQTADVLSRQAEQNAASMQETSAALEELSASVAQVNSNISDVRDNALSARTTAESSEKVAAEAAASMERIADGSKEITRVTDVIHDIAFQINLLALNAGVEAARAGDAGRGFSVVASEVRLLAQRASEAAKEISQVLTDSDTAVFEGVSNVSNAKSALDGIAASVVKISESVEEVTRAVSEQASGIQEISSAMSQVDANTQKQAAAFEEVTASSHLLAEKAGQLRTSTSQFQVHGRVTNPKVTQPSAASLPQTVPASPSRAAGAEDLSGWSEF
ncbi:MAG: methyl-accepting chemotaxis protein [Roseobacter sp.]|jgi:methyl-accepting chemotaxis protein|nr:methyl-accepting chemotaxis protein [Roseobacter sp.]